MQGSSQRDSGELDVLWLVAGILLLCGLIFFIFRSPILSAILWVKYGELRLISLFVVNDNYQGLANWVHHTSSTQIQFAMLQLLALEIGESLKYPCALFSLFFAVIIYIKHPDTGYRDIETMKTLANKVRKMFPAINIVNGLELVKTPVEQGPWAMAETPIEFAKKYKLIHRDPKTEQLVLDQNKTKLIFSQQLGEHWKGVAQLRPHQKALFAIFAAFANYKRDEAEAKMEEIAANLLPEQLKSGKINFNTDVLLKKYQDTPIVKKITQKHAYVNTIFMELLTEARKSGIVLNSLYLWLKPLDRKLWYVLNNVGRKAVFSEAGASQAHWLAERRLGFAISQPMVDEAVAALSEFIQSRIIKDL